MEIAFIIAILTWYWEYAAGQHLVKRIRSSRSSALWVVYLPNAATAAAAAAVTAAATVTITQPHMDGSSWDSPTY